LHHNGRRGVDHVYFIMPNQQYSLTAKHVPIVRIIFDSPTYIHTYIHTRASIKKCWNLCYLAVIRYLSRTADVDNCTVPLNSGLPATYLRYYLRLQCSSTHKLQMWVHATVLHILCDRCYRWETWASGETAVGRYRTLFWLIRLSCSK
jgi:hypothetical protein